MDENTSDDNAAQEKDSYVFLDFNGKIPTDVFEEQVFMRIVNLHKTNPLVQVNDIVFKGTYDYSVGTNLFFEEVEDPPSGTDVFERLEPIHLKHILSEMKVLNLRPVKVRQEKVEVPNEVKKIDFKLKWDYNELLKRFENGTLDIDDIVKGQNATGTQEETEEAAEEGAEDEELAELQDTNYKHNDEDKDLENTLENIVPIKILESEYDKLKVLARRPVKRAVSPELVAKCDEKYEEAYEYHNIERQILQPSDAFRIEPVTDLNEATLSDCVDIDRCVLHGVISPSSLFPRILSKKEKEKVLSLENFDNLSLAARYYVLKNHVQDLENYVKTVPEATLHKKDEFGRTPMQTLETYRKLCEAVANRLREIKCSLSDELVSNEDFQEDVS